jgi:ER degradation enhancer, mannosidase alpha-like 2
MSESRRAEESLPLPPISSRRLSRRGFLQSCSAAWLASAIPFVAASPATAHIAKSKKKAQTTVGDPAMASRVREEFLHAWNGYKQYVWGYDELKPLSKQGRNWYATTLLLTPVDALDTMIVLGLDDEALKTREYIARNLSFDHDIYVKNFEITIRVLGGLLSSYQLSGDKRLLDLAEDLGNRLLPAFDSPTGMPFVNVNLKTGAVHGEETNPAEVGTLLMEFGTLSKLTGKPVYFDKSKRALVELYNRRSAIGLVGLGINAKTGAWTDPTSNVGGGIDSYYEYLLKCSLIFGDKDCEKMWKASIDAVNKYVADETPNGLWYGEVNMNTGARIGTEFGALDAFLPGTLALSGDLDRARKLQESCYRVWTTFGLEPQETDYSKMKVTMDGYPLQPEIIESTYYLYHFTKDQHYLDMGRTFFDSVVKYCRNDIAYAALNSVETKEQADIMQSYFLAETMKYFYLLFAPPETLDLKKFVFNTEAHPLRKS